MKRVLQIVGTLNRGGLETVAVNCMKYSDPKKYHFDFLVYDEAGELEEEVVQFGGNILRIRSPQKTGYLQFCRQFKRLLDEREPYDIVHAHTYFSSAIPIMVAKKKGVPCCIAHAHSVRRDGDKKLKKKIFYSFMRAAFRKYADKLCACSEEAGSWVFGKSNFLEKGIVLPNVIDIKRFAYNIDDRKKIRVELNIDEDDYVIGCVGRLVSGKNIKHLIDVFATYRKEQEGVLLIVGDGPIRQDLEQYTESLGLKESVCFVGTRTDVPELLSAMDIFVMPSKHEGLGIVLLEAMANGLFCVVKDDAIVNEVKNLPMCVTINGWEHEKWIAQINSQRQTGSRCELEDASMMLSRYSHLSFEKELDALYGTVRN